MPHAAAGGPDATLFKMVGNVPISSNRLWRRGRTTAARPARVTRNRHVQEGRRQASGVRNEHVLRSCRFTGAVRRSACRRLARQAGGGDVALAALPSGDRREAGRPGVTTSSSRRRPAASICWRSVCWCCTTHSWTCGDSARTTAVTAPASTRNDTLTAPRASGRRWSFASPMPSFHCIFSDDTTWCEHVVANGRGQRHGSGRRARRRVVQDRRDGWRGGSHCERERPIGVSGSPRRSDARLREPQQRLGRANSGLTVARHARHCLTGQAAQRVRADGVTSRARLPEHMSQESRGACSCGRRAGHRCHLRVGRLGLIGEKGSAHAGDHGSHPVRCLTEERLCPHHCTVSRRVVGRRGRNVGRDHVASRRHGWRACDLEPRRQQFARHHVTFRTGHARRSHPSQERSPGRRDYRPTSRHIRGGARREGSRRRDGRARRPHDLGRDGKHGHPLVRHRQWNGCHP